MKHRIFAAIMSIMCLTMVLSPTAFAAVQPGCSKTFFGLTPWYEYLESDSVSAGCNIQINTGIKKDYWLIGLAIIQFLLEIAGIIAFVFVLSGAFKFVTSQGEPDRIAKARQTILNALVGLVIAIIAANVVAFIARSFS